MISSILWKEYREQRVVWAALAVVGAALLVGLPAVMAPGGLDGHPHVHEALFVAAAVLAWVYGVVCGGLLLAGEREMGTLPFLDALPGWRGRLWRAKCLVGVLLALAQAAVLASASAAAGLTPAWTDAAWLLSWLTVAGLFGLGWGLLFSARGRNAMDVILLSLPVQLCALCFAFLAGYVVGAVAALLVGAELGEHRNAFLAAGMIGIAFLIGVGALTGSALVFTAQDRSRLRTAPPSRQRKRGPSWSAPFWLTWRQARGFAVGVAVFALFLGLATPLWAVILWPLATLLIGVLCGATAFMDEQEGPYRFLGDQRFPLGRLWLVKVGVRFAIAVAAALIVLAPTFFVALANSPFFSQRHSEGPYFFFAHVFGSNLIENLCPSGVFLTIWLVTGFAAGCLCGLLFRSGLAAGVVALFVGTLLTAAWVPSMLGGGLHIWQALGAPALLLLSTRWLLRPWAAGRIASWATAVRLTPFVVLALLWAAGGLWYRIVEIPYIPEKADLDAFRASLPTPEQNEGGELSRRACLRFKDLLSALRSEQPPPRQAVGPNGPNPSPMARAGDVLEHGWPADDAELAAWLDKLFAGEWVGMLKKAADLPPGMFDDLRNYTEWSLTPAIEPAREIAVVLAARGLQKQAAGDDEAYVENLRIGLHLSQTLRHTAPPIDVVIGRAEEGILLHGLDRWLEKLKGRPDLLQKALGILSRYLDATANDSQDQELVDDLILRNSIDDPLPLLQWYLGDNYGAGEQNSPRVRAEAQGAALAWLVPWERERQDRILRIMFWGDEAQRRAHYSSNQFGLLPYFGPYGYRLAAPIQKCQERAMLLKLALRWYQADNGRPADKLDELIPKYLPSIPADPYDGKPFRYRLSKGEKIEWPEDPLPPGAGVPGAAPPGASAPPGVNGPGMPGAAPPPATRTIPAGQGILWCVGKDGQDDGGHRQTGPLNWTVVPGEDVIFLVPLPPKND